ncbi:hypothetical protein IAT38_006618 [Cryptococcus sp. DSM 104549]
MTILAAAIRTSSASLSAPSRSLATSAPRFAAAAPATPAPTRFARRAPPARPATTSSSTSSTPAKPAYSRPAPARATPRPASSPVSDDPFAAAAVAAPGEPVIGDYAQLAQNVSVSPPLSELPGESYVPLPSASTGRGPAPISSGFASIGGAGIPGEASVGMDWSTSFAGLSERPFSKEAAETLLRPLTEEDVEIKPDGLLYMPEIRYRRILNRAFGPGAWGLAPRGETHVGNKIVSREWGLVILGRLASIARGEQEFFDPSGITTAVEACKSNALMRCCKDLGIASELWDPTFIRDFKAKYCVEVFATHATRGNRRKKLWRKKNAPKFEYPFKE